MKSAGLAALVCGVTALGGCTSLSTPMTDFATDYNRVIADTRNEMILLNIVRARYREPTHYSTLSQVSGNIAVGGSAGIDLSGIIDDFDADASAELSIRSAPSFQIVPLNTRESANGILRPIEANVVAIFLAQGWDQHQLAALLVESVTCNGVRYHVDLRPDAARSGDEPRINRVQAFALGFESGRAASSDEAPLMAVPLAGSDVLDNILDHLSEDYRVTIRPDSEGGAAFEISERVDQVLNVTTGAAGPGAFCNGATLSPDDYELRSVEGVIYFLGEVLRDSGELLDDRNRVIFGVSNARPASGHSVHVRHNDRDWYIARHDGPTGDRSIQIVSLISQLISLQTSSDVLQRSTSTLTVN